MAHHRGSPTRAVRHALLRRGGCGLVRGRWVVVGLLLMLVLGPVQPAAGQDTSSREAGTGETLDSVGYLLRRATRPSSDGEGHRVLLALRYLGDPGLAPLFAALTDASDPVLRLHGILGLAETEADGQVSLEQVRSVSRPAMQSKLIGTAMDSGLLSDAQAKELLGWAELAAEAKLAAGLRLVARGQALPEGVLVEAERSPELGPRMLASLLRLEAGPNRAVARARLWSLHVSDDRRREEVCRTLLETALRHELKSAGRWAAELVRRGDLGPRLRIRALEAAMRFGAADALELWASEFKANYDLARRMRLALLALKAAPDMPGARFELLSGPGQPDAFLRELGRAAEAIASGEPYTDAVVELIHRQHPLVNRWALEFCRSRADERSRREMLAALIAQFDPEPRRHLALRIDLLVAAVRMLAETEPEHAERLLLPMIDQPEQDRRVREALLLGLYGARGVDMQDLASRLPTFSTQRLQGLRLLLLAKHGATMSPKEIQALGVLARGGMGFPLTLRISGGWYYARLSGKTDHLVQQAIR